jgi:hypothetical protein
MNGMLPHQFTTANTLDTNMPLNPLSINPYTCHFALDREEVKKRKRKTEETA